MLRLAITLWLISGFVSAQQPERIELLNADLSEFDQDINPFATRLLGNVIFRHADATMYCDSAYLYRNENRIEAFNRIRILQGDSLTLTGDSLQYNGNTKTAQVFGNVVMTDRKMTLHTNQMDYDMNRETAFYADSGHIVDGRNTLTSKTGYYVAASKDLFFRYNVKLVNPDYVMTGDTLRYNTATETSFFLGPTYIKSDENLIYCEDGWYNTSTQLSSFSRNSYLLTRNQRLTGDSVVYDRNSGIGRVYGRVMITDTVNDIIITGDYGEHHERSDSSWVTGHALMTQVHAGDSLFLHGDTLMATGNADSISDSSTRNLFAFHDVRLFRTDLQGVCDSLVYDRTDSTIRLYKDPILWSGLNQLTADSVWMQTSRSEITHIHLINNAFICSLADSSQSDTSLITGQYNQIRGKDMTGYLSENKLYKIDVLGNGQTIYYAKNKMQENIGVNRADCSDMAIYVNENEVKTITLLNDPDGTLYPIRHLSPGELRLKGFSWHGSRRPASLEDLFSE
jgi:lipopolysaccharide export system protein LptA